MEILNSLLSLLLIAGGIYHLFSLVCVREFFGRKRDDACAPSSLMPVSIIKPLKGADPEFKENLRTFCRQEYPEYEVLLGFSEPDGRAVKRLKESIIPFIDGSVRVVISTKDLGANKKVSNLQGLVEASQYQLLAISDSDMRVDNCYLRNLVYEYYSEKKAGMVTCLYKISNPRSIGTALESLTIALDFIPSVLAARRLEGVTFGLGATMLLSKKALEDIGGFPAIADYLADDYQIGNRLWKKGYKIVLSHVVIENVVGTMSVRDYITHQIRWARTYRASRPKGFAGYGITHIFPVALLLVVLQGPTTLSLSILGAVLVLRLSFAMVIYRRIIRSKQWLKWLAIIPIKDILSFGIWIWSFAGSTVTWRGRSYKILKEGRIVEEA